MVKSISKLGFRKLFKNKFLLIGLALIVLIGITFFVTLFTTVNRYEETAEIYFKDYVYADCTFYGDFEESDITDVQENGAQIAEGRYVKDYRRGEITYRAISLTKDINKLYYYEGTAPGAGECVVLKKNADALNLKTGDTVDINSKSLKVSGIIGSPEYIYLVKNERSMMSNPETFAVIFTDKNFFEGNYNEILAEGLGVSFDNKAVNGLIGAQKSTMFNKQINYTAYRADLKQIGKFAYIFPGIFALLIIMVVYVVLKRAAVKDKRQISAYKALGAKNHEIIKIYLIQFITAFTMAALIGCALSIFLVKFLIGQFSSMFEFPLLTYKLNPWLWAGSIVAAILLCVIPGMISLRSALKLEPAQTDSLKSKKRGSKILLERTPLWKKFSFNTRYTLRSMFRSKARFFSMLIGLIGTIALLTLSLGFMDSINNTKDEYFERFARYDLTANFQMTPNAIDAAIIGYLPENTEYAKALQIETEILETECNLTVVDEGFDFLNIDYELLKDGVIVPEYFADMWKVKKGDTLEIEGKTVKISGVFTQTAVLSLYTSYDYFLSLGYSNIYNTVFVRGGNLNGLTEYLNENMIMYSTLEDDKATFNSVSESLNMVVMMMVVCSLLLGISILYTVGLTNLSARESEYMLLNTLGYSRKKIMLCFIKETLIQIILAIPIGLPLGLLILLGMQGGFSNSSFALKASVFPLSYALSGLIVIAMAAVMYFVTRRQIGKIDIVQGLKAQND